MNQFVDRFFGRIPRVSSRLLPQGYSQVAENTYLKSGDLEAFKDVAEATFQPSKTGFVRTIYGFDKDVNGDLKWLHWTSDDDAHPDGGRGHVEVAKGFTVGDDAERFYYTGTDVPRETTGVLAKTGGGTDYPITHYKLGTPNPTDTPTAIEFLPDPLVYGTIADGTTVAGFTTAPEETVAFTRTVATVDVSGTDYIRMEGINIPDGDVGPYLYTDLAADVGQYQSVKVVFICEDDTSFLNLMIGAEDPFENTPEVGGISLRIRRDSSTQFSYAIGRPHSFGYLAGVFSTTGTLPGFDTTMDATLTFFVNRSALPHTFEFTLEQGATVEVVTGNLPNYARAITGFVGFLGGGIAGTDRSTIIRDFQYFTTASEDSVLTNYLFTNVSEKDGLEEESAPSVATTNVFFNPESGVVVSGIEDPSAGDIADYNITKKYLYRAVTGTEGTVYQFVAEVALGVTEYTDMIATADLEPTFLESLNWELPPTEGRNITAVSNGIMIITSGKDICPSVKFRPHAYPLQYRLATEYDIVGVGVVTPSIGRENEVTAVILTTGPAYLLTGTAPESLVLSSPINGSYGCTDRRSIVSWKEFGVVYSAAIGLIGVSPGGAVNLTEKFAYKREYIVNEPSLLFSTVYDNHYYSFREDSTGGFIFDPEYGFIDLTESPISAYLDPEESILYLCDTDSLLVEWEGSEDLKTYIWKSKLYLPPYPTAYNYCQIRMTSGSVTLTLYKDRDPTPYSTRVISSSDEFVIIPITCREFEFQLSGTGVVNSIMVAETMEEIQ